jgi:DNA-binding beta-propeller fold protein YncE
MASLLYHKAMGTIPEVPVPSRRWLLAAAAGGVVLGWSGCARQQTLVEGRLDAVWGRPGSSPGRLFRPRAITIGPDDLVYIVDMTPRIQVFTPDGRLVRHWQPPQYAQGRPSGLAFDNAGRLMVCDTHYYRVLFYTPQGQLLEAATLGGVCGGGDGEFQFVTDAAQDRWGHYYVAQYGEYDRIQKFSPEGKFLLSLGEHGQALGQFLRPQKLVVDHAGLVWVADACNHRVQVFDARQAPVRLARWWGTPGEQLGQLRYPYDILLDEAALAGSDEGAVYLCEFGNHRVQKFTLDGRWLGSFGRGGRGPGQLDQPWGIARDRQGRMYVLDTYNHRVQRFWL